MPPARATVPMTEDEQVKRLVAQGEPVDRVIFELTTDDGTVYTATVVGTGVDAGGLVGAGPGPLEPGSVVRWLSRPAKPCPKALP